MGFGGHGFRLALVLLALLLAGPGRPLPRRHRIDAHGIDHAIGAGAQGHLAYRLDRVVGVEVDRLGPLGPRHGEPLGQRVHRQHAAGAHKLGAGDGELAHRAATEHCHGLARLDVRHVGAEVAGGNDVGDQDGVALGDLVRQPDHVGAGVGDARVLRLQAVERPGGLGAAEERRARELAVGIGLVALGVVAGTAVIALPAGDGGGNDHPVADGEVAHPRAHLLYHAHGLVAEHGAGFHAGHGAAHHVQVGTADGAAGDLDDGVVDALDLRLGNVVQTNVADTVEHDRLHDCLRNTSSVIPAKSLPPGLNRGVGIQFLDGYPVKRARSGSAMRSAA